MVCVYWILFTNDYLTNPPPPPPPPPPPSPSPLSQQSYDPATIYSEGLDEIDETLPSLAELSLAEAKYQNIRLTADPTTGLFDVTLRYFSIQPTSSPMVSYILFIIYHYNNTM